MSQPEVGVCIFLLLHVMVMGCCLDRNVCPSFSPLLLTCSRNLLGSEEQGDVIVAHASKVQRGEQDVPCDLCCRSPSIYLLFICICWEQRSNEEQQLSVVVRRVGNFL